MNSALDSYSTKAHLVKHSVYFLQVLGILETRTGGGGANPGFCQVRPMEIFVVSMHKSGTMLWTETFVGVWIRP